MLQQGEFFPAQPLATRVLISRLEGQDASGRPEHHPPTSHEVRMRENDGHPAIQVSSQARRLWVIIPNERSA